MSSKHINAQPGDFAETVLMPGDPLRARFIAETYLQDVRQVNDVRNMWGFTGTYEGMPISVLEAAEVYMSANEAPVQSGGGMGGCGVIVLWTRAR